MPMMRAGKTTHTPPFAVVPGKHAGQAMTGAPSATNSLPGYSLLGWRHSRAQRIAAFSALCIGGGLAYIYYVWYPRSGDVSPDSVYGYGFAIAGTLLLLAVGIGYAMRKRWRRHGSGRLHTMLAWHMVGALLGLVLILMHASGNFNPRTGTYALYGLIAVVISGIIGRALDRLCPWLAARAALQVLTASGEERLDDLERQLGVMLSPKRTRRPASPRPRTPTIPWDIGYYDLDPDVETIPALVGQGTGHPAGPTAVGSGASGGRSASPGEVQRQARAIQAAMAREHFYIHLVRTWRRVHTLVSLVFLGLLVWHLVYAFTLLMNTW
jgi:hypothetical protein